MPTPNKSESKDDWMKRCMGDKEQNLSFPDQSQRYAVCESKWKEYKHSSIKSALSKFFNKNKEDIIIISGIVIIAYGWALICWLCRLK